jgi:hypothetical protein
MVNLGGIKKKFHIKALSAAANKTGKISNVIANNETVNNRINATTLYPTSPDNPKHIDETNTIIPMLNRYCLFLSRRFKKKFFMKEFFGQIYLLIL